MRLGLESASVAVALWVSLAGCAVRAGHAGPGPLSLPDATTGPLPRVTTVGASSGELENFAPGPARIVGTARGGPVTVIPLAPDEVGATASDQPVLYWYVSRPITSPVVFALIDTRTVQVARDVRMPPPFESGVQAISFKQLGIVLEPNVQYRWYVDVVLDDDSPSRDVVSGGMIEWRPRGSHTGEAGLWYDAIAAVSERIAAAPRNGLLRRQRAALLQRVGLVEVADWDLTHARTD